MENVNCLMILYILIILTRLDILVNALNERAVLPLSNNNNDYVYPIAINLCVVAILLIIIIVLCNNNVLH